MVLFYHNPGWTQTTLSAQTVVLVRILIKVQSEHLMYFVLLSPLSGHTTTMLALARMSDPQPPGKLITSQRDRAALVSRGIATRASFLPCLRYTIVWLSEFTTIKVTYYTADPQQTASSAQYNRARCILHRDPSTSQSHMRSSTCLTSRSPMYQNHQQRLHKSCYSRCTGRKTIMPSQRSCAKAL